MMRLINISSVAGKKSHGFTLIEMLLVLVIVSTFIVMGSRFIQQQAFNKRIERTSMQIQQILNASIGYYVANGAWPADINALVTAGFLPNITLNSPWNTTYKVKAGSITSGGAIVNNVPLVYVWVVVQAGAATSGAANIIAGTLPMAYSTKDNSNPPLTVTACVASDTACTVVATASVPGQNLNNASAVNYANLYHNGACVPAPQCPIDPLNGNAMTPQIMVIPVSVSGVNDSDSTQLYPINSFTAYATPLTSYTSGVASSGPAQCDTNASPSLKNCYSSGTTPLPSGRYWRVCLQVVTSKGTVSWTSATDNWGHYATVLAITRCAINNEYSGKTSGFTVYSQ